MNDWNEILKSEYEKTYYHSLSEFVKNEYAKGTVFPPYDEIFNAFRYTSYANTRVVIIGQDPYHNFGQAQGLCFSVKYPEPAPPSLQNIYKELADDLGCYIPNNGELIKWARQGVLLLNTVLTVKAHQANSHANHGWETFTDAVLTKLNEKNEPIVFMLWGSPAQSKARLITNPLHLVLKAPHPSPLSAYRGFFGCKHFSKANEFLREKGFKEIDWQIENK